MSAVSTLRFSACPERDLPDPPGDARVLTPNPRAADTLGVPFRSLDAAARRVLRSAGMLVASELAQWRELRRAVQGELAPDDLEGTLRALAPSVRDVLRVGLDAAPEAGVSARAARVLSVAERYRANLAERRQVDPAELLWSAARHARQRERVLVAGYPRVGPGEYAFLRAFAAPGSAMVLPERDPDAERELVAHGWRAERGSAVPDSAGEKLAQRLLGGTPHEVSGSVRALRFASQEDEVRHALTWVKRLLQGGTPAERIALVARDDALYGPLVEAIAWEYRVPVRLSYGVPLRDTRVGAWLGTLAEVVRERAPFEATARLLAHPLTRGMDAGAWQAARGAHPSGVDAWREIDPRAQQLRWPARDSRAGYADRLDATLAAFGVAERVGGGSRDALALARFDTAARALATPAEARLPLAAFLAEALELLTLLSVPYGGRAARGVALHTPLALYGARVDHAWLLGLAEGVTPAPVRDDPVLDFFERDALHAAGLPLERAVAAARREDVSFAAMLRSVRRELVLGYPERLAGSARIASPYLARLGLEPASASAKPPASPEEARRALVQSAPGEGDDPTLNAARAAWRIERTRESEAPYDGYDGVVGVPHDPEQWVFSASQLTRLGQCPFKWFAERLLRLREPDEAEDDISPLLRGRLWHGALEHATRSAMGSDDLRAGVLAELEPAFERAEAEQGVPAAPTWPQRRREHLQQLRQAVLADDFLPAGAEVLAVERAFETEWRGLRVRGVVDRIDRTDAGLRLVDYKTRSSKPDGAKDAGGRATLDVQLPLYLQAAAPELYPGEEVAEASYYSLTGRDTITRAKIDDAALDQLAERAKTHLRAGAFPVDPDVRGTACSTCDFDLVCRRGPRLERKRHAAGGEGDA